MLSVLTYAGVALFVVFFFGLCIFVHEFGHLVAALWRGLYVERFSVGFGRRIWGFTRQGVDYVVGILPFGGYVMLPQLDPTETPQTGDGRPLPPGRPVDRIIAAVAGPVFNVLFGFLLGSVVWAVGVYQPASATSCDVIAVPADSPEYAAGLRPEDQIVAVNGRGFRRGWPEVAEAVMLSPGDVTLRVRRPGIAEPLELTYTPAPNPEAEGLGKPFFRVRVPTGIRAVVPGSPAARAGLRHGDLVLRVDGQLVEDAEKFVELVRASGGRAIDLVIERDGVQQTVTGIVPKAVSDNGRTIHIIGVQPDVPYVLTHPTPWAQFVEVFTRTERTVRTWLTRSSLVKARHLSGPVGIAHMIGANVYYEGLRKGLAVTVFISFSLALINCLPIPVLDGGHVLWAVLELVTRRRMPVRVAYVLQIVCASLIIGFMLYVTVFDVRRVGRVVGDWFRPAAEEPGASPGAPPRPPAGAPVEPAPAPSPDAAPVPAETTP